MRLLTKDDNLRSKLIWWLIFLRIPFPYISMAVLFLIHPLRGQGLSNAIYLVGTNCLIAALIYLERERLCEYHIDPIFLWMFALGKPLELALMLTGLVKRPSVYALILYGGYILASLVTVWVIWKLSTAARLQYRRSLPGIVAGIIVGLVCGVASGFIIAQQDMLLGLERLEAATSLGSVLVLILHQASFAGLAEEPLFRGFLWGYLKKAGWNENKILVYQAALFSLAHLQYLFAGYWGSLLLTFLLGLILGWLVKRSRAISATVVGHGLINGVGQFIAGLICQR
ncbi:MAG: CPBP family intramembrane metalloprotease [Anaerolineales bacterium]|nr:CPBP family intramembrane metalloprotease [Anaerolineales bacterium]